MDALVLSLWVREMRDALVGARITEAGLFGSWRVSLRLRDEAWLTLSLERALPAVFLDSRPRRKPTASLPGEMERVLVGAEILDLEAIPGERILRMPTARGALVVELVTRAPAAAALDADGRVVASIVNTGGRRHRLAQGRPYEPPESPPDIRFPGLDRRTRDALATHLAARDIDPESAEWVDWLDAARERLAPRIVESRNGAPVPRAFPIEGEVLRREVERLDEAVRRSFAETMRRERELREARAFRSRLGTLAKRVSRALRATGRDLERAQDWPTWERYGSALHANPHLVKRGEKVARVPDVFETDGTMLEIPVDPRLGAAANAAVYMKRARRGQRSIDVIRSRRDSLESDHEWLSVRKDRARDEWSDSDLATLEKLLVKHRVRTQTDRGQRRDARRSDDRIHPRRYRSSDGWLILVGRNNEENDYLSLKVAKQEDIWMHAHGVAGSHVVIKREGRKDNPSKQTLEEAASIAALHSKARHAGTVPVVYTKAKYVSKPRKAPPGLVTCTQEKTIMVRPANPDALTTDEEGEHERS